MKRAGHRNKEGKNEQTRLKRCLLYVFVDYSGFEKVIKSY